jgi:transposase-like protein
MESKISKYKIKQIQKYFCLDLTATQTSELMNLNRKTINRYYRLFRDIIYCHQEAEKRKFVGEVEVDESYFGKTRIRGKPGIKLKGRSTNKQPVFGIYERKGRVYTEIVPDCKKATLQAIIRGKADITSVIHSDGWPGYDGLVDVGYEKHFRVNHNKEFANKTCHINGIEAYWSFTKRRLAKFNGVKVNFHLHLKECEWRYRKDRKSLIAELSSIIKVYSD